MHIQTVEGGNAALEILRAVETVQASISARVLEGWCHCCCVLGLLTGLGPGPRQQRHEARPGVLPHRQRGAGPWLRGGGGAGGGDL